MSDGRYYKVVQTQEGGYCLLSPVPQHWEKDGYLFWPPSAIREKALKQPWAPHGTIAEGWTTYACKVKRNFIPTYSQALSEIKAMSDASDTASEAEASQQFAIPQNKGTARTAAARKFVHNADQQRSDFSAQVYEKFVRMCSCSIQSIYLPVASRSSANPTSSVNPTKSADPTNSAIPNETPNPTSSTIPWNSNASAKCPN